MPILLTTPADPGDNDSGNTYPRAKIYNFSLNTLAKEINVNFAYGDVVDDVWAHGNGLRTKDVGIKGADYDTLIAALSNDGEGVYAGAHRLLYQYLIDNGHLVGTVE